MEKIDLGNEFVRHFLAESLSYKEATNIITERELQVSLTVNGHSIPFVKSLEKIYNLFLSDIDKRAAEKVLEKNNKQLYQLEEIIETCRSQLKFKVEEIFEINLN